MKTFFLKNMLSVACLALGLFYFTACDDEQIKESSNIEINNIEIGEKNSKKGVIGGKLLVQAYFSSTVYKLKEIEVRIKETTSETVVFSKKFERDTNKTELINSIDVPDNLETKSYLLELIATDSNNGVKKETVSVFLTSMKFELDRFSSISGPREYDNDSTAYIGTIGTFVEIVIDSKKELKETSYRFFNDENEFFAKPERSISSKNPEIKEQGSTLFRTRLSIPTDAKPGVYKVAFEVTDVDGNKDNFVFENIKVKDPFEFFSWSDLKLGSVNGGDDSKYSADKDIYYTFNYKKSNSETYFRLSVISDENSYSAFDTMFSAYQVGRDAVAKGRLTFSGIENFECEVEFSVEDKDNLVYVVFPAGRVSSI